jgi:transcriptional regulator with XRE-family HTH domain
MNTVHRISPAQCRAARGLLGITIKELAQVSDVSERAIAAFEKGRRHPIRATAAALKQAFEMNGVRFAAYTVAFASEEVARQFQGMPGRVR